jgi:DNA-binding response OmpR family regulator
MEQSRQITILIVDDEEILREAIALDFVRRGFNVLSAENGNQAFELIQREKIDLVISDLKMPECDGPSLLRKVRAKQHTPPFIFISGGANLNESDRALLSSQKFIQKPFDYKVLQNTALEMLGL